MLDRYLQGIADAESNHAWTEGFPAKNGKQRRGKDDAVAYSFKSDCKPSVGDDARHGRLVMVEIQIKKKLSKIPGG